MDHVPGTYRKQPEGKVRLILLKKLKGFLGQIRVDFALFLEPIDDGFCSSPA
jgi:hypothetical protein